MKTIPLSILVLVFTALLAQAETPDAATNWKKHCAKCHAADGTGKTKMGEKLGLKDYTDPKVQEKLTDEEIFKATKEGVPGEKEGDKSKMNGYADKLSEAEIHALVAYIRTMKK